MTERPLSNAQLVSIVNFSDSEEFVSEFENNNKAIECKLNPPPQQGHLSASNLIKTIPGFTRCATIICHMPNIEGRRVYGQQWANIDCIVFQAYVGLLLLAGVTRSHGESTKSLWDQKTGRNILRATMSLETFCKISRVFRFDKKSTRE
ncbi:hypothetical protein ANN_11824 [Periplaneta americana]|uniref:PiggyBac transposable element-derived protein domain-containing protein n=1 Tax=Periplaneta americana TaxID=6978 RepID=A0ABQ8T8C8_PERAM|nr:hypothetical protein ANN_11824 [Periplaneta americana]